MVKVFLQRNKSQSPEKDTTKVIESNPNKYIFLVYVKWSQDNRVIKTYIKTENLKSECDMICNGLSDIVADPDMKLNSKNIKMAILYQLNDDHDVSVDFDVTGIVPTRLDHYLNSNIDKRIDFSQEQIDDIVNKAEFTYRPLN
jgi:hypothetical protein